MVDFTDYCLVLLIFFWGRFLSEIFWQPCADRSTSYTLPRVLMRWSRSPRTFPFLAKSLTVLPHHSLLTKISYTGYHDNFGSTSVILDRGKNAARKVLLYCGKFDMNHCYCCFVFLSAYCKQAPSEKESAFWRQNSGKKKLNSYYL